MTEVTRSFCWHQNFAPCPGVYICIKSWKKNCIKSDFKEISLKLTTMGKMIKPFCWHQNFVPWGVSTHAPGLYTCIKSWKKLYKIKTSKTIFWNLQQMNEVTFLLKSKLCPLGAVRPSPGAIYMYKSWKKLYKIRLQRDFWRSFCWHQNFAPLGAICPLPRGIYMY